MLESFVGALFLAAVLVAGWRLTASLTVGRRRVASASAGVAVAYVFVYMLPELNEAGSAFVEATRNLGLPLPEYRVYVAALVGFVLLYGVEHLRKWSRRNAEPAGESGVDRTFVLHVGGFAAYVMLVTLTMAESAVRGELPTAIFCFAMALHFLGIAGDLFKEHGALYLNPGRYMMAAAVMAGWLIGANLPVPPVTLATLLGVVSGGVVVNSMIMELPSEKNGRFGAFVLGAGGYALLLLLLASIRINGTEGPSFQLMGAVVDQMAARLTGPMNFRFVLQPLVAIALGVRDGRLDARGGVPPFVIDVLFASEHRRADLASALKSLGKPVLLGTVLDAIAQYQIFRHVGLIAAVLVGAGVIGVPYALARGLANRFNGAR